MRLACTLQYLWTAGPKYLSLCKLVCEYVNQHSYKQISMCTAISPWKLLISSAKPASIQIYSTISNDLRWSRNRNLTSAKNILKVACFILRQTYVWDCPSAWRSFSNWNRFMGSHFYDLSSTHVQKSIHKWLFPLDCTPTYISGAPKGPRSFTNRFRKESPLHLGCIQILFQRTDCYVLIIRNIRYYTFIRSLTEFWYVKHTEA